MSTEPVSGWPHHSKHGYSTSFWPATSSKAWLQNQFLAGHITQSMATELVTGWSHLCKAWLQNWFLAGHTKPLGPGQV